MYVTTYILYVHVAKLLNLDIASANIEAKHTCINEDITGYMYLKPVRIGYASGYIRYVQLAREFTGMADRLGSC